MLRQKNQNISQRTQIFDPNKVKRPRNIAKMSLFLASQFASNGRALLFILKWNLRVSTRTTKLAQNSHLGRAVSKRFVDNRQNIAEENEMWLDDLWLARLLAGDCSVDDLAEHRHGQRRVTHHLSVRCQQVLYIARALVTSPIVDCNVIELTPRPASCNFVTFLWNLMLLFTCSATSFYSWKKYVDQSSNPTNYRQTILTTVINADLILWLSGWSSAVFFNKSWKSNVNYLAQML